MGELLMCVSASPDMASGLALAGDQKEVVAFIGDSTFFHAGLPERGKRSDPERYFQSL
jgi:indolepyruvate ferredoxin oxidoreductase, alpha subunit